MDFTARRVVLSEMVTYMPLAVRGLVMLNATLNSGCNPFNLSLHVLSFLLASLDLLLRDTTHWLPANTHSSGYDNHFDPSFRRSTPRKGIKERVNASITQKLYMTCVHA